MKKINLACIIEDDPVQMFITNHFLGQSGRIDSILVYSDGKEAFEKLSSIIESGEPLPELILLDLNMPIWDGWQFLDSFTQIPLKKPITIYILTSSNSQDDIQRAAAYNLSNHYIIKPVTFDKLVAILDKLD